MDNKMADGNRCSEGVIWLNNVKVVAPGTKPHWQELLEEAVHEYLCAEVVPHKHLDAGHFAETPERIAKSFAEFTRGLHDDPKAYLAKVFPSDGYDEMVHVQARVVSRCAHHFEPIIGKAYFAYVPDKKVVGLSKIPRFIRALSHRPQVQEALTVQIVDLFNECVQPKGCAVAVRAYHFCMIARGVEEPAEATETVALRGSFSQSDTRNEFLATINRKESVLI